MTEPELTPDELELAAAKQAALIPAEVIPDAVELPDDVHDGRIEDEAHAGVQEQPITEPKED